MCKTYNSKIIMTMFYLLLYKNYYGLEVYTLPTKDEMKIGDSPDKGESPTHIPGASGDYDMKNDESFNRPSNERYDAFMEEVNDGFYETDIHGNFTYFNNALCKVLGYSRDEIKGNNFGRFMDDINSRKAYEAFTKVWVTHEGFTNLILEIEDREDKTRVLEISANLIKNPEGKKTGFRGIARDVTGKFNAIAALRKSEIRYQQQYQANLEAEQWARNVLDFIPYPMVVATSEGKVSYLNPAFTDVFGWTLDELKGKNLPYVPTYVQKETNENIKRLLKKKLHRFETKRYTKDGRVLDVEIRGGIFSDGGARGELIIIRDITHEKKMILTNDTLLRISTALPSYPVLEDLMDYISGEVKRLLNTEGALVMILDEEKEEIFFQGAAYDDSITQTRIKKVRFPVNKSITGKVIRSGKPVIVPDTSKASDYYPGVDEQAHLKTRNMLIVPLKSSGRIIGVLNAINKKEGTFNNTDLELLTMIAGTVALSVENARYSEELKDAYTEVTSLNRAKDKVINHLSHELKTPVSVLLSSLKILAKKMQTLPTDTWEGTFARAERNLERILEIQYEVEDIMLNKDYRAYHLLSLLLEECTDEIQALTAEEFGEVKAIERIRERIEEIFGPKEVQTAEIDLGDYTGGLLEELKPQFAGRRVDILCNIKDSCPVLISEEVLRKTITGLVRNAVENSPDGGKIEIAVGKKGNGTELKISDFGVGITEDDQKRIFEGFFTTQETSSYSSKRPFDFNAGGKGADLLRIKIFSERYNFRIGMESARCKYINEEHYICPGDISRCDFCTDEDICFKSGGTAFRLFFPSVNEQTCPEQS